MIFFLCCDSIASLPFCYYFKHCKMWSVEVRNKIYFETLIFCDIMYSYLLSLFYILLAFYFTNMSDGPRWLFWRWCMNWKRILNLSQWTIPIGPGMKNCNLQNQFTAIVKQVIKISLVTHRKTMNIALKFSTFNTSEQTLI